VNVSRETTIFILTKEAALQKANPMADEMEAKYDWKKMEVRDTGEGVVGYGDLCCDLMGHDEGGEQHVCGRIYVRKVKTL
jgi:hypothetical protein